MYKILITTTYKATNGASCGASVATQVVEFNTAEDAKRAVKEVRDNDQPDGPYRQHAILLFSRN